MAIDMIFPLKVVIFPSKNGVFSSFFVCLPEDSVDIDLVDLVDWQMPIENADAKGYLAAFEWSILATSVIIQ